MSRLTKTILGDALVVAVGLAVGVALGWPGVLWRPGAEPTAEAKVHGAAAHAHGAAPAPGADAKAPVGYACPMFCTLSPRPGPCPKCGMKMEPVYRRVFDERMRRMSGVETEPVTYRDLKSKIAVYGHLEVAHTRHYVIAARYPGRIESIAVKYEGQPVRANETLAVIFAPALDTPQRDYLVSYGLYGPDPSHAEIRMRTKDLKNLDFTDAQIEQLRKTQQPVRLLDIRTPKAGTALNLHVRQGQYVKTGDPIVDVADLSVLWAEVDVYERDLQWAKVGREIELRTDAYPNRAFTGRVVFVNPVVNDMTRSVKVRVEVPNPDGVLKPKMFVRGALIVSADELAGVKTKGGKTLAVPKLAVLSTGRRHIVYVEKTPGDYELRELKLGPRCGDYYPVVSGLKAGEKVVARGAFLVDSAMQLAGEGSLIRFAPEKGTGP